MSIYISTTGFPLKLEVLYAGSGYNDTNNIPTFVVSKYDLSSNKQIIPEDQFTNSLGSNKIDNLHVDLTLSNGSITQAIPNYLNRGFGYHVGDVVSVYKNGNKNIALLYISYIS